MIYSENYSSGYSDGDNSSSAPSTVTSEEFQLLENKLDLLLQRFDSLATKDYIDSKIPFVDDMSLKAFKAGQKVTVFGFEDVECTVMSSQLLPTDLDNYIVIYTVRYTDGDNVYTSNFPASHCLLKA